MSVSTPKEITPAPENIALVLASALSNLSGAFMKSNIVSSKAASAAVAKCHSAVGLSKAESTSNNKQQTQLIPKKKNGFSQVSLENFDQLPDSAFVRQTVVLGLFSCSKATLWRWVKSERLPSPLKLGLRLSAWNVGQLRSCLKSMEASGQANSSNGSIQ